MILSPIQMTFSFILTQHLPPSAWPNELKSLKLQSASFSSVLHGMYPIIVVALFWGHKWSEHCILIHSDNTAVVDILNKGNSRSTLIMQFVRTLTLM